MDCSTKVRVISLFDIVVDICRDCSQICKCTEQICQDYDFEELHKTCDHCQKKFCKNHFVKCQGCNKSFCKDVKMRTLIQKNYCESCSTSKNHLDFKLHDLEKTIMNDDCRSLKINGDFQGVPLIKVKSSIIPYPTHLISSEELKNVKECLKVEKPEIHISSSFTDLLNEKIKEKINESLYLGKGSLQFSFEKFIVLDKDEELKKERIPSVSDKHIGNLFIILPSIFQGGSISIIVPDTKKEITNFPLNDMKLNWISFMTDSDFEISKLTSGNLMILVYKIMNAGLKIIRPPKLDLVSKTKILLDTIFTNQEKIGFILLNKYETIDENIVLKAKDSTVFHTLNSFEDYKVKIEEFEVKNAKNIYEERCDCERCREQGDGDELHYTIVDKQFPTLNEHKIQWRAVTREKPFVAHLIDGVRDNIYKHGMIVIQKRKRKRNGEDDDEDVEVAVLEKPQEKSVKCPISKCTMDEPVKSKVCGHSYDKLSIFTYFGNSKTKECPLSGCNKEFSIDDLVTDFELAEIIKNRPQSEDDEEEKKVVPKTPVNTPKKKLRIARKSSTVVSRHPPPSMPFNSDEVIVIDD